MTTTADRQHAAEVAALLCLQQRYGISHVEVVQTRLLELCHLADLIRAHTDHLDPATATTEEVNAGVLRAVQAFTAEF
jgi:hypothetical protein